MLLKCANPEKVAAKLKALNARFIGIDHQIDTLRNSGISKIVIVIGYKSKLFEETYQNNKDIIWDYFNILLTISDRLK